MGLAKQQEQHALADEFARVRAASVALSEGLAPEDCNLQAMPETSPVKWHLAHTSWFFEAFVLEPYQAGYLPLNPLYNTLFNSYYNGIGEQYPRAQRSLLSRPTLDEVYAYRTHVDEAVSALLAEQPAQHERIAELVELGLHHEAQHQELLLTDLKYNLFQNPLFPAYRDSLADPAVVEAAPLSFIECGGGEIVTGYDGNAFCFDNEQPAHISLVQPFGLASRLISNAEYIEFIEDGGYTNPEHWLADGWVELQAHNWQQPLYWGRLDGQWLEFTLHGLQPLNPAAPVSHVSYFEAQAFAAWAGKRLPTETEWESVARPREVSGNFVDSERLQPAAAAGAQPGIQQLFGDCWEWTNSAYLPYPGYSPLAGAVGEYNGKFMSGQMVLRGGSCLSRAFHIRASYRNFFYPRDRWQCAGIRLAANI